MVPVQLRPKMLFAMIVFFNVAVALTPPLEMPWPLLSLRVTLPSVLCMAPLVVLPVKFAFSVTLIRLNSL